MYIHYGLFCLSTFPMYICIRTYIETHTQFAKVTGEILECMHACIHTYIHRYILSLSLSLSLSHTHTHTHTQNMWMSSKRSQMHTSTYIHTYIHTYMHTYSLSHIWDGALWFWSVIKTIMTDWLSLSLSLSLTHSLQMAPKSLAVQCFWNSK
jgi:hypothetical protein